MKNRRRGFTLIEMIASLAVLGTALLTIVLILHTMYRADEKLRDELAREQTIDRLTVALRQDAHLAVSARALQDSGASAGVLLTLPANRTVRYGSLTSTGIERLVSQDNKPLWRESYRLPDISSTWQIHSDRPQPLVTLRLSSRLLPIEKPGGRTATTREVQIHAATQVIRPPVVASAKPAPPKEEPKEETEPTP